MTGKLTNINDERTLRCKQHLAEVSYTDDRGTTHQIGVGIELGTGAVVMSVTPLRWTITLEELTDMAVEAGILIKT